MMNQECNFLLQKVNEASFALDDVTLYLDTHPDDTQALSFYQYVKQLREEAVNAYEASCGPLQIDSVNCRNGWSWLSDPWPWEGGC